MNKDRGNQLHFLTFSIELIWICSVITKSKRIMGLFYLHLKPQKLHIIHNFIKHGCSISLHKLKHTLVLNRTSTDAVTISVL